MKLQKSHVVVVLMSVLLGCATPYSKLTVDERDALLDLFMTGDAELICSLTSGYGKAMSAANAVDRQVEFFESGQWPKLAVDVLSVEFGGDKEWFYLGRAAEGLGYLDAANTYYETSLSKGFGCRCLGKTVCGNLNFPEVAAQRLSTIQAAQREFASLSHYDRARKSELDLQTHVSFYQCHRWAKGKSSEELRAFMASIAAGVASGIIAGQIVDSGSVAENALMGAAIGISVDATARIYRDIRFPESGNRGKDFAYLFDECMEGNGLYTDTDRLEFAGWKFTDDEAVSLVGLRGKLLLVMKLDVDQCKVHLRYFNQHTRITNPTIEITLFDLDRQSISEHVVSYPSVFPGRSHVADLEVSVAECESVDMGYISSAFDQLSMHEISELKGSSITACRSNDADCAISVE